MPSDGTGDPELELALRWSEAVNRSISEIVVAVPPFPDRVENLQSWLVRDVVPIYFGKYSIAPEDVADVVVALLRMPERTLVSRVEMRPLKPRK